MEPIAGETKERVVQEARSWIAANWPDLPPESSCLYATLAVMGAARKKGIELIPQAGSVSWLAVAPHLDDGMKPNAASYFWDPDDPMSQMAREIGVLPEMHCWAVDPIRLEVIDITTGFQMKRFRSLLDWSAEPLPDFLWSEPRPGWIYEPHKDACLVAFEYMRNVLESLM